MAEPIPQPATTERPYRVSGPTKKGLRSIGYGLSVLAGFLTGGFSTLIGVAILGAATIYSGTKSAISLYKSFSRKYKEKSGSYFGRGLSYLGRTFGTISFPWLQGLLSLLSGGERIRRNEFHPYDYQDIPPFEQHLRQIEAEAATQPSTNTTEEERTVH